MIEFKIQLDDDFVKTIGHKQIENYLQEFTKQIIIKSAALDILNDLKSIDFSNDKEWAFARNLAWEQEKHKYSL